MEQNNIFFFKFCFLHAIIYNMKRFLDFVIFCFFAIIFVSCEIFTTPVFTLSADVSDVVKEMSTDELVSNLDKFDSEPKELSAILDELAFRDDLQDSSIDEKENILSASISAVLPMTEFTDIIQQIMNNSEEEMDLASMLESLIEVDSCPNMASVQNLLQDELVLQNGDAYTIMLSSLALVISVVNDEKQEGESVLEELAKIQIMVSESADETTPCNKDILKAMLEADGYKEDSVESIITVMGVLDVLNGTAADDMPDRSVETDEVSFFGINLKEILNGFLGVAAE